MVQLYLRPSPSDNEEPDTARHLACVIPLVNGKGAALVDEPDYDRLKHIPWYSRGGKNPYACRVNPDPGGPQFVYMHREIMPCPPGMVIDHRNHNTLDNRRASLRIVSESANLHNISGPSQNNTTGYAGVMRHRSRWRAQLRVNGKRHDLGLFDTPEEASAAYWEAKKLLLPHLFS